MSKADRTRVFRNRSRSWRTRSRAPVRAGVPHRTISRVPGSTPYQRWARSLPASPIPIRSMSTRTVTGAPVHARERRAGPQVVEPGLQDVPGEERQVTQVLERMDAPGPQPVLVEERPAVRNVLVHELEEAPEAPQAVLLKPSGGEPLAGLQL